MKTTSDKRGENKVTEIIEKTDKIVSAIVNNGETQDEKCRRGEHRFVECDEWEPTCINCGKFL